MYSIRLRDKTTSRIQLSPKVMPASSVEFETNPTTFYAVRVKCEKHAEIQRHVSGTVEHLSIHVPVLPASVTGFRWPDKPPVIPGINWDLDSLRRAALLNIWAKMCDVKLAGNFVSSFVKDIQEVHADRILCEVDKSILYSIKLAVASASMRKVSTLVGHEPPPGYSNGISIKTPDDYGNLQVSIFEPEGFSLRGGVDDPLLADVDIDEEGGAQHFMRVMKHHITGAKSNPVEIHGLLLAQGIDPLWRPLVT